MSSFDSPPQDPGNFFTRLIQILVYVAILGVVRFALWGILLMQMILHLIGAGPSPSAQRLGQTIADYVYRVWLFLTYNSNERPFPFSSHSPGDH